MGEAGFERQNRWWSPDELDHLHRRFGKACRKTIARELRRSERSVKGQIARLGLRRVEWPL